MTRLRIFVVAALLAAILSFGLDANDGLVMTPTPLTCVQPVLTLHGPALVPCQ